MNTPPPSSSIGSSSPPPNVPTNSTLGGRDVRQVPSSSQRPGSSGAQSASSDPGVPLASRHISEAPGQQSALSPSRQGASPLSGSKGEAGGSAEKAASGSNKRGREEATQSRADHTSKRVKYSAGSEAKMPEVKREREAASGSAEKAASGWNLKEFDPSLTRFNKRGRDLLRKPPNFDSVAKDMRNYYRETARLAAEKLGFKPPPWALQKSAQERAQEEARQCAASCIACLEFFLDELAS